MEISLHGHIKFFLQLKLRGLYNRIFLCSIFRHLMSRIYEGIHHKNRKLGLFNAIHGCHELMLYDLGNGLLKLKEGGMFRRC